MNTTELISEEGLLAATAANSSFSRELPGFQLAWDSSSLIPMLECPRKYFYSIIMGYRTRGENVHLDFGAILHQCLELRAHMRLRKVPFETQMRNIIVWALLRSRHFEGSKEKNRKTLIRTLVAYMDKYKDDPMETVTLRDGSPAVEVSFRIPFSTCITTQEDILLCGHLDEAVKEPSNLDDSSVFRIHVRDAKSSKYTIDRRWFQKWRMEQQMTVYAIAGHTLFGEAFGSIIIDGLQVVVTFTRLARGFAPRSEAGLDESITDLQFQIQQAEAYAAARYWPKREVSCNDYGGCAFRDVCSRAPYHRQRHLDEHFTRRIWDPLETR